MYQAFDLEKLRRDNPREISKNPFEHQKDAFEKLTGLFTFADQEHKAGILVLPTGAGKTFTSVNWICRNVLSKNVKVLWLAHTGHLLEQAYDTFRSNLLSVPPTRRSINILVRQHKDLPEDLVERLAQDSGRNDYIVNDYLDNYQTYGKTIIFADRWVQCVYLKKKLEQRAQARGISLRVDAVYSHVDASASTAAERNQRTPAENSRILHAFRNNELDVLLNVRMLAEGTDVPNVGTVFITRETTSSILLTQMIGRALRGKAAGGGPDKEVANIVFFVDNWKKAINFATPESGGIAESEPRTRGAYPLEFISIALIENLSRQMDSGLVFSSRPYLDGLPVGWYETVVLAGNGEETEAYREFVIVSEARQPQFERFLQYLRHDPTLAATWENDNLDDDWAQQQAARWITEFFDLTDHESSLLNTDLIKLARHVAQHRQQAPPFYSFEGRDKHNLSRIAGDLLQFNEYDVQDKLYDLYQDGAYQWQSFYKSYDRFKTAFDAERNRIFHIRKFGSEPTIKLDAPTHQTLEQRELTEEEKEQVFHRDGYTCQCCGKQKAAGRKVKLEVDHITPFRFGGESSLNNSQTLCSQCNSDKGINTINFKVLKSPLATPKPAIELKRLSRAEYVDEELKRIINMFYHCKAVAHINCDSRPRSKYRYQWEIALFEGNDPTWLEAHKNQLIGFIRTKLNYPELVGITIR